MNRLYLKQSARESLTGRKPSPMLVAFLYMLISGGVELVVNTDEMTEAILTGHLVISPMRMMIVGLAMLLVGIFVSIVTYGWYKYSLQVSRGQEAGVGTLFDGLQMAGKVILLALVKNVLIFLWSLLLFVPGIIKTYAYSQAENLLIDHPDWGIMQVLTVSQQMMQGYKMELFILELSFLGWMIASVFTLGILALWVNPYMSVTFANFYNQRIGYAGELPDEPQDNGPSVEDYWKN